MLLDKVDTEGGKPSKHGGDQLQQLYSHEFQVIFWESTRGYTQVRGHTLCCFNEFLFLD